MATLLCMRLADMRVRHPQQDNSHRCSVCGHRVGLYPAGAAAARSGMVITCSHCHKPSPADIAVHHPAMMQDAIDAWKARKK